MPLHVRLASILRPAKAFAPALLIVCLTGLPARAQNAKCVVAQPPASSEADEALAHGKFADAERLYAAMPQSDETTAGVVRARLGLRRFDDALAMAQKASDAHPDDAALLDLLGEVRFRRGEVDEAALDYNRALKLNVCFARTHFDVAQYYNLSGNYLSAQGELDTAHKLAPADPAISRAWGITQGVPLTPEQQAARLEQRLADPRLPPEAKATLESQIKILKARGKGSCELTQPLTSAKVVMWPTNPTNSSTRLSTSSGVDVMLNGKRRRFMVDTGASGLLLSADAAKSLGLTPEAETKTFGFGDEGMQGTYLAHVDTVTIGGLEFHNCMVRVLETNTMKWTDGLLGPDMFSNFLVTLDFPASELRLSPLPPRPDETPATKTLDTSGEQQGGTPALTFAQTRKDRYIAPEMKDWTRVFRNGHHLLVQTSIGNAPKRLFILDTGAGQNLISPDAAREVTHVFSGGDKVRGLSGEVAHVSSTDSLSITFARVRQAIPTGLNAIDMSAQSRSAGVEISGFIGYPILRELVLQIDYRDNLIHVTYEPHVER